MIRAVLIAAALLLAGAADAQEPAPLPIPADHRARVDGAAAIGRLIHDYDQAAWITTDVMYQRIPRDRLPKRNGGWVVEPRADGALVVTYYSADDGPPRVIFVAAAKDGKVIEERVVPAAEPAGLTAIQSRMVAAQAVARTRLGGKGGRSPCEPLPFNSVTLAPRSADDPVTVYYLTAQRVRNIYPFGGHYRFDVDRDGKIVVDRAFTNSCIAMDSTGGATSEQTRPVALAITHLLDPSPTEIHVWLSLWMRMPIFVSTPDRRIWEVAGTNIRLVSTEIGSREAKR